MSLPKSLKDNTNEVKESTTIKDEEYEDAEEIKDDEDNNAVIVRKTDKIEMEKETVNQKPLPFKHCELKSKIPQKIINDSRTPTADNQSIGDFEVALQSNSENHEVQNDELASDKFKVSLETPSNEVTVEETQTSYSMKIKNNRTDSSNKISIKREDDSNTELEENQVSISMSSLKESTSMQKNDKIFSKDDPANLESCFEISQSDNEDDDDDHVDDDDDDDDGDAISQSDSLKETSSLIDQVEMPRCIDTKSITTNKTENGQNENKSSDKVVSRLTESSDNDSEHDKNTEQFVCEKKDEIDLSAEYKQTPSGSDVSKISSNIQTSSNNIKQSTRACADKKKKLENENGAHGKKNNFKKTSSISLQNTATETAPSTSCFFPNENKITFESMSAGRGKNVNDINRTKAQNDELASDKFKVSLQTPSNEVTVEETQTSSSMKIKNNRTDSSNKISIKREDDSNTELEENQVSISMSSLKEPTSMQKNDKIFSKDDPANLESCFEISQSDNEDDDDDHVDDDDDDDDGDAILQSDSLKETSSLIDQVEMPRCIDTKSITTNKTENGQNENKSSDKVVSRLTESSDNDSEHDKNTEQFVCEKKDEIDLSAEYKQTPSGSDVSKISSNIQTSSNNIKQSTRAGADKKKKVENKIEAHNEKNNFEATSLNDLQKTVVTTFSEKKHCKRDINDNCDTWSVSTVSSIETEISSLDDVLKSDNHNGSYKSEEINFGKNSIKLFAPPWLEKNSNSVKDDCGSRLEIDWV